jgi:hypothetical protein
MYNLPELTFFRAEKHSFSNDEVIVIGRKESEERRKIGTEKEDQKRDGQAGEGGRAEKAREGRKAK